MGRGTGAAGARLAASLRTRKQPGVACRWPARSAEVWSSPCSSVEVSARVRPSGARARSTGPDRARHLDVGGVARRVGPANWRSILPLAKSHQKTRPSRPAEAQRSCRCFAKAREQTPYSWAVSRSLLLSLPQFLAAAGVPQHDIWPAAPADRQGLAVGHSGSRQRCRCWTATSGLVALGPLSWADFLAGGEVPEPHRIVAADADEQLAIRRQDDGLHGAFVTRHWAAGLSLPVATVQRRMRAPPEAARVWPFGEKERTWLPVAVPSGATIIWPAMKPFSSWSSLPPATSQRRMSEALSPIARVFAVGCERQGLDGCSCRRRPGSLLPLATSNRCTFVRSVRRGPGFGRWGRRGRLPLPLGRSPMVADRACRWRRPRDEHGCGWCRPCRW